MNVLITVWSGVLKQRLKCRKLRTLTAIQVAMNAGSYLKILITLLMNSNALQKKKIKKETL